MEGVSAHTHKLFFLKMQKDPHFEVFDNIISSEIKLALKIFMRFCQDLGS